MAEGWGQRLMTLSDFIRLHIAQQQRRQQGGAQRPAAVEGGNLRAGVPASDSAATGDSEPPGSSSPTSQVGFMMQHHLLMQHRLPCCPYLQQGAAVVDTSWCTSNSKVLLSFQQGTHPMGCLAYLVTAA